MSRVELAGRGLALNTRIDGPRDAPWLVLSNSLGADLTMWEAQVPALTARYRVLRYDTRGHGQSDAPPGPYALDELVADALALMDALGIERASWMGLSMGGMTGLGLGLAAPERFERIVCADGRADAPEGFRAMWDTRIARVGEGGLEAIVEGTLESWLSPAFRAGQPQAVDRIRAMVLGTDPAGYVACCAALKGLDYLRRLGAMAVPVLYVGGTLDKGAAPEVMRAMADATPGARYLPVDGAAHLANVDNPRGFHAAIAPFLGLPGR